MNIDQIEEAEANGRFDHLFDMAEAYDDSMALHRIKNLDYPSVNPPSTSPYPDYPQFKEPRNLTEVERRDLMPDSAYAALPKLSPYSEPGLLEKGRNILRENGPVMSALAPLFGLQYKDFEDAPRNIAGGVAELTGSPMAGEAVDVAAQFIPGIAAIGAYDNGRIPGVLDFTGALNPLKWTKAEKLIATLGGGYDLFTRWLNSIPKRDKNK